MSCAPSPPPNKRVQRTRLRSPLTRHPLGARAIAIVLSAIVSSVAFGCQTASVSPMTGTAEPEDVLVDTCDPIIDEAKESHPLQEYRLSVRDSAGLPISDAKVVISSGNEVRSNSEGIALFAGRPNDSIRVSHDGFVTVSASVCWIGRDSTITMRSKTKVPHAKP